MTPAQIALWLTLANPVPEAYHVTGIAMSFHPTLDYWADTFMVQRWLPRKLAEVESSYRPTAQSYEWVKVKRKWVKVPLSRGLMQINRYYQRELAAKAGLQSFNWRDAGQSARVGVALFSRLLNQSRGDYIVAVAKYNAGHARIESSRPIPTETIRYVWKVFGWWEGSQ